MTELESEIDVGLDRTLSCEVTVLQHTSITSLMILCSVFLLGIILVAFIVPVLSLVPDKVLKSRITEWAFVTGELRKQEYK